MKCSDCGERDGGIHITQIVNNEKVDDLGAKDLARKIARLEKKYDARFKIVFDAIRALMEPPETSPKDKIGYLSEAKR